MLVNDDGSGRSQFLPRIAVDGSSGFVGVSWYDARNDSDNARVQVYAAVSGDGGATFGANVRVSDGMSVHRVGWNLDFGGYAGLAFFGGSLFPVWVDNSVSLNNFEVYTDRVVVSETITLDGAVKLALEDLKLLLFRQRPLELLLRVLERVQDQAQRVATFRVARLHRLFDLLVDRLDPAHAIPVRCRRLDPCAPRAAEKAGGCGCAACRTATARTAHPAPSARY